MELRQLKYFLAILESGSMSKAETLLHIAQPALSQQMRNLENELSVRLLDRKASGVTPTAAGKILRDRARVILRLVDEIPLSVAADSECPAGEVNLGLPPSTAKVFAIPLLLEMKKRFPEIRINYIETHTAKIRNDLEKGIFDLAIAADFNVDDPIKAIQLVREQFYLVVRTGDYPVKQLCNVPELARFPLILPSLPNKIRQNVEHEFQQRGLTLKLVANLDPSALIVQAVRSGVGASVLSWAAIAADVRSGALQAMRLRGVNMNRTLFLCTLQSTEIQGAVRAVHTTILELFDKQRLEGIWNREEMLESDNV